MGKKKGGRERGKGVLKIVSRRKAGDFFLFFSYPDVQAPHINGDVTRKAKDSSLRWGKHIARTAVFGAWRQYNRCETGYMGLKCVLGRQAEKSLAFVVE